MTTKGERTRREVVAQAASLFNRLGYRAASISDVMEATGLQKGGIYRHFDSKEALALEAFNFAVERMRERFQAALEGRTGARERLLAIVRVYARIPTDPPVPGGCPLLNAAVEADDGDPVLRAEAERVMNGLKATLKGILKEGQKSGELAAGLEPEATAHVIIAQLEGGVMLSKLYGNDKPMRHVVRFLEQWIDRMAKGERR